MIEFERVFFKKRNFDMDSLLVFDIGIKYYRGDDIYFLFYE